MGKSQTVPEARDEPAWAQLIGCIGETPWRRLPHGLKIDTAEGPKSESPAGMLYSDRAGRVGIMFAGSLERSHAPLGFVAAPSEASQYDAAPDVAPHDSFLGARHHPDAPFRHV